MYIIHIFAILIASTAFCAASDCFEFKTGSYLKFTPDINVHNSAHYKLKFKTSVQDGTLFFAQGPHGDFERIYLSDGVLHYFLFNPSPTHHDSSFGAHSQGFRNVNGRRETIVVSDGVWHTVEYFRNTTLSGRSGSWTGMLIDGIYEDSMVDSMAREDVDITSPFYFGGTPSRPANSFIGRIKEMEELINSFSFVTHSHNEEVTTIPNC